MNNINNLNSEDKCYSILFFYLKQQLTLNKNCDAIKFKVLSVILNDEKFQKDYYKSYSLIQQFLGEQCQININKDAQNMTSKIMHSINKDYLAPIINELYEIYLRHSGKKLQQKVCRDIMPDEDDVSQEICKPIFLRQDSSSDEEEYNRLVGIEEHEIPLNEKLDRVIAGVEEIKLLTKLKEEELKTKLLLENPMNEICPSADFDIKGHMDLSSQFLEFLLSSCQKSEKMLDELLAERQEAYRLDEEFCEIGLEWLEAKVNALIDKENLLTGQVMRAIYPDATTIHDCIAKKESTSKELLEKEKILEELKIELGDLEVKRGPEWTTLAKKYVKTRRKMQKLEKREREHN